MALPIESDSVNVGVSAATPVTIDETVEPGSDRSEDEIPSEVVVEKKRKKTSAVWKDLTEIKENGKTLVKCNHCGTKFAYTKGGPTSSYKRHIASCTIRRAKMSGKGSGKVQGLLSVDAMGSGSLTAYKYDKEAIKDVTAKMILVHEYPFKIVEHKMFRIHNKMLNPKYEPFGRLTIRDHVMKLYAKEKEKMKGMFASVGKVSLTSDLWTSNQTKGYMCITAHFVDVEWKLQNRIINFCLLPPPHTGIAIADKMFECLSEWGLENNISSVTLDNATSNDVAIRSLKDQFKRRNALSFGGKIFHVRCCAHILNLLVQDGLVELTKIIENIRESVKFINLTPSRLHKWKEVVKLMSLPTNKKLMLDVPNRWNSTFHMLERALIFKDAFPRYASRDPSFETLPSDVDWETARDVCKFLSTFDKVTELFSGRDYTTANLYFSEIWMIRELLDATAADEREFMRRMVKKMKEKFDKYWNECNFFMIVAAVLDPRNKLQLIRFIFANLYAGSEVETRLETIKRDMHIIFDDYVSKEGSCARGDVVADNIAPRTANIGLHRRRADFEMWVKSTSDVMPTKKELDIYFEEGVLMDGDIVFDVLSWWKSSRLKYPILSKMARDILSIPVTSVPSESAFSAGRRVIGDDRCSLGDNTIEGLLCASNWFRNEYNSDEGVESLENVESE